MIKVRFKNALDYFAARALLIEMQIPHWSPWNETTRWGIPGGGEYYFYLPLSTDYLFGDEKKFFTQN